MRRLRFAVTSGGSEQRPPLSTLHAPTPFPWQAVAGFLLFFAFAFISHSHAADGPGRAALQALIVKASDSGARLRVMIDIGGRPMRHKVVRATADGLEVSALGMETNVPWSMLSDKRLAGLASKAAGGDALAHLLVARFLAAKGLRGQGEREVNKALELDGSLREKAAPILLALRPKAPAPPPAASNRNRPAGSSKKPSRPRAKPGPADAPVLRIGKSGSAPAWAQAELRMFDAYEGALGTWVDRFVEKDTGSAIVKVTNWGTADDIAEGIAVWDRFLVIAGSDKLRDAYVSTWKNVYKQLGKVNNGFRNGYYRVGYDAEHASELLQHLWGAIDLAPEDKELQEQNRIIADHLLKCLDPNTRLWTSMWLNNKGGNRAKDKWGKCSSHDLIQTNAWSLAWMTTGDEKYRKALLDHLQAWARLTEKNGGIIPCWANTDGTLIPNWWDGLFSYKQWGIPGTGARGWHSVMTASVLMTGGDTQYLKPFETTMAALIKNGRGGKIAGRYDGSSWSSKNTWSSMSVIDRLYDLTWDDKYVPWVKAHGSAVAQELYFGSGRRDLPGLFDRWTGRANDAKKKTASARTPRTGDELRALPPNFYYTWHYIDGNFWTIGYDNGRCGGIVNAPLRYFREDGKIGLPKKVAARVTQVTKASVSVSLHNANAQPTRVLITGGHYGTHRIDAVGGAAVGGPRVIVEIPGGSTATFVLRITRHVYKPTITPYKSPGVPIGR